MSKAILLAFLFIFHAPTALAAGCDELESDRVYYNWKTVSLGVIATLPGPLTPLPGAPEATKVDEYGVFSIQAKRNERSQIEIEGVWINGKYIEIKVAKEVVTRALTQAMIEEEATNQIRVPEKGAMLYRTLSPQEWEKVLKDGNYLIVPETAFELEQRNPPATGVLIRIKDPGPYFTISATGTLTNRYAHFAKIDVFDRGGWISLDGYRVRHNIP